MALAALACLAASSLRAESTDAVVGRARALMHAGRAGEAVELLEAAVEAKPDDGRRHYWLGVAYGTAAEDAGMLRMMSLAGKARDAFTRAVAADPGLIDARLALVEFHLLAPGILGGGTGKAREQAAEIRKRDALAGHRAFADIAAAQKDMTAARAEYAAAIRESPVSPEPHYWYAVFLMTKAKDHRAAAQELDAALRLDPGHMRSHFQVGHLAALTGANAPRGEESLRRYLGSTPGEQDPGHHRAHYWLGVLCEKQGKRVEARRHFEASLRLRPGQKDAREALERVTR